MSPRVSLDMDYFFGEMSEGMQFKTDTPSDSNGLSICNLKAYQHGIILFEGAETVKRCRIGSHHIALDQWIDGAAFCFHNPDNIP